MKAAILLAGCGHYGMDRHFNDDWHIQTISGPQTGNGNWIQSQGTYEKSRNTLGCCRIVENVWKLYSHCNTSLHPAKTD